MIIFHAAGAIIEHEHGAVVAHEELFQGQYLAPIAQGVLSNQPHLGQGVQHEPLGPEFVDRGKHGLCSLTQLEFRWIEHGQLAFRRQVLFRRHELGHIEPREVPAVAAGDPLDFALGLGKGDIQATLAPLDALQQELHSKGGLAGAGHPRDQKQALFGKAAAQDVIQADDAGGHHGIRISRHSIPPRGRHYSSS